jgi:hypothetical protein
MPASPASARLRLSSLAFVLVLPFALGCGTPARAVDRPDGRWVQLEIVDRDSGRPLRVWRDHGDAVVAGTPGARYAVRLVNRSGERVLAVVAVDGINIVSGETAGVQQRGYVLSPWGTATVNGWRKSGSQVAAFEFTALADSYAARTGRPDDVGVIGVAVFRERPRVAAQVSGAAPAARAEPAPAPRADGAPARWRRRRRQPAAGRLAASGRDGRADAAGRAPRRGRARARRHAPDRARAARHRPRRARDLVRHDGGLRARDERARGDRPRPLRQPRQPDRRRHRAAVLRLGLAAAPPTLSS